MNDQRAPVLNTPEVVALATAVEDVLTARGVVIDRTSPPEAPAFGLELNQIVMILGGLASVASFVKACLDIRKLLDERAAKHKVKLQPPKGAAISIGADSDDEELERTVLAAFAEERAPS
jgi:hypothetical protein